LNDPSAELFEGLLQALNRFFILVRDLSVYLVFKCFHHIVHILVGDTWSEKFFAVLDPPECLSFDVIDPLSVLGHGIIELWAIAVEVLLKKSKSFIDVLHDTLIVYLGLLSELICCEALRELLLDSIHSVILVCFELVKVEDVEANDFNLLHQPLRLSFKQGRVLCLEVFLQEVGLVVKSEGMRPLSTFLL
jgi:hypothetical protein